MPVIRLVRDETANLVYGGFDSLSGLYHAQVVKWQTRMVKVHVPSGVEVRILSWVLTFLNIFQHIRPGEAIGSLRRLKIFVLRVRLPPWVFLRRGEATGSLRSFRNSVLRVRLPLSVFSRGIKNGYYKVKFKPIVSINGGAAPSVVGLPPRNWC